MKKHIALALVAAMMLTVLSGCSIIETAVKSISSTETEKTYPAEDDEDDEDDKENEETTVAESSEAVTTEKEYKPAIESSACVSDQIFNQFRFGMTRDQIFATQVADYADETSLDGWTMLIFKNYNYYDYETLLLLFLSPDDTLEGIFINYDSGYRDDISLYTGQIALCKKSFGAADEYSAGGYYSPAYSYWEGVTECDILCDINVTDGPIYTDSTEKYTQIEFYASANGTYDLPDMPDVPKADAPGATAKPKETSKPADSLPIVTNPSSDLTVESFLGAFKLGASKAEIEKAFGKADFSESSTGLVYNNFTVYGYKGCVVVFSLDEKNNVKSASIMYMGEDSAVNEKLYQRWNAELISLYGQPDMTNIWPHAFGGDGISSTYYSLGSILCVFPNSDNIPATTIGDYQSA